MRVADHPLYDTWSSMRSRCNRPSDSNYVRYGGRGVRVCERWMSFDNFVQDMGEKPTPSHSLDRIDGRGNYEPENCRWASPQLQQRNLSSNRIYWYMNRGWNVHELASHAGIKPDTLKKRVGRYGWPVERAVETPLLRTSTRDLP